MNSTHLRYTDKSSSSIPDHTGQEILLSGNCAREDPLLPLNLYNVAANKSY